MKSWCFVLHHKASFKTYARAYKSNVCFID